jgi:hypothetical protein
MQRIPPDQTSPYPKGSGNTVTGRCSPQQKVLPADTSHPRRHGDHDDGGVCTLLPVFVRYRHLQEAGIVNNWPGLLHLIKKQGFPCGQMLGPNTRVWKLSEIYAWLDSRPTELKKVNLGTKPRGRPRKNATVDAEAAATTS